MVLVVVLVVVGVVREVLALGMGLVNDRFRPGIGGVGRGCRMGGVGVEGVVGGGGRRIDGLSMVYGLWLEMCYG